MTNISVLTVNRKQFRAEDVTEEFLQVSRMMVQGYSDASTPSDVTASKRARDKNSFR